ncbi:MAG: hypothetical protein AABZ92_06405 [Verrucomicrobiota bacterium]
MTINIKTALYQAQTYQELVPIAKELCAGLSCWGYQYATVTAQSLIYQGTIAVGAIAEKAMKIRQRMEQNVIKFTPEEKNNVILLSREISRLYGEDTVNCERADKRTTLCKLIMSIIFWVNHQSKWNNNRNGPSYKEQLQQPLSINLKTAVNKAQNYQELLPIANELHAGLSWWGYQYAHVPTSTSIDKEVIYTGRIATGAIAKKALKIRQEMKKNKMGFTENEADSGLPFCKKIYCLYVEDKSLCNQANQLTAIFRSVVRVIFWADHQSRWRAVWDHSNKVETYPEIICEDLPGSIAGRPVKGEWSGDFIQRVMDWEDQGATYIPFPNGT